MPSNKKKRKERDTQNTDEQIPKSKKQRPNLNHLLSDEVRKQLGVDNQAEDDTNIAVIDSKKVKNKSTEQPKPERQLSKRELRKLKQLEEKKRRQALRASVYETLSKTQLPDEKLKLLRPSKSLGKKETTQEKLKRALQEEKFGLPVSVDVQKLRKTKNWQTQWTEEAHRDMYGEPEEKKEEVFMTLDFGLDFSSNKKEEKKIENEDKMVDRVPENQIEEKIDEAEKVEETNEETEEPKKDIRLEEDKEEEENQIELDETIDQDEDGEGEDGEGEDGGEGEEGEGEEDEGEFEDDEFEGEEEEEEEVEVKRHDFAKFVFEEEDELKPKRESDSKIIEELLDEADKKKTPEQKEIKYTKFYVPVDRTPEIQEQRLSLPVTAEEQPIMEKIYENDVFILCGETGSGKTTQVPQFLYEAGFANEKSGNPGMIGVTQPRRVAAISTSKRVAEELNVKWGEVVSYQVRYDHNVNPKTKIKFMTDGILLREIQTDSLLLKYSVIVIDEAHERNVNTDILIGWLSRFIPTRNQLAKDGMKAPDGTLIRPLKLIIMSATLRVDDFVKNDNLFRVPPPVFNVKSRQYPVTIHFSKRTAFNNYLDEAFKKACKIHEKLPQGGILIFLTGRKEIEYMVRKLQTYSKKRYKYLKMREEEEERLKNLGKKSDPKKENEDAMEEEPISEESFIKEMGSLSDDDEENEQVLFEDNIKDEKTKKEGIAKIKEWDKKSLPKKLHVLPLYSMLDPERQMQVFQPPPEGSRLCVVATNIAETSLTIPNIRYVIDTGRVKDKVYNLNTGFSKFEILWTSQASANQRAGRAGRTGPGHCYRLYSSAVFDQKFKKFADPDIVKIPIDSVVLQMKNMGIQNIINFPFPTPPEVSSLKTALKSLTSIGAIDKESGLITSIGTEMSKLPVDPRYAKMLILASNTNVLSYIIAIVCSMTVGQIFVLPDSIFVKSKKQKKEEENDEMNDEEKEEEEEEDEEEKENERKRCVQSRKQWANAESDYLAELTAVGAYEYIESESMRKEFCKKNFLHAKNMGEVHKLRYQLVRVLNKKYPNAAEGLIGSKLLPPKREQQTTIRQIICSSFVDRVARLATIDDLDKLKLDGISINPKMKPYIPLNMERAYENPLFIHPTSFLYGKNPQYVVYNELTQGKKGKTYMKGVTAIHPAWLPVFGKSLCTFSKPIEGQWKYNEKKDRVTCMVFPTYGASRLQLPITEIDYPSNDLGFLNRKRGFECQLFAKFLFEGKVFKDLQKFSNHLIHSTNEFIEIVPSRPAQEVLRKLVDKKLILSKERILNKWKEDPNFLKEEYLKWVKPRVREAVKWPPKQ